MSWLDAHIATILPSLQAMNPAVLVHDGNTYSCFKSYGPNGSNEMDPVGFIGSENDLSVIVAAADIKEPLPQLDDPITLNGEPYVIRPRITKTGAYWWLMLEEMR
jgi:hypothetical protein